MKLKAGAALDNVSWRMFLFAIIVEPIFALYGVEMVITSGTDSSHSLNSEHYKGLALDLRSHDLNGREGEVLNRIKQVTEPLGYATILESDHFHAQYSDENIRDYEWTYAAANHSDAA